MTPELERVVADMAVILQDLYKVSEAQNRTNVALAKTVRSLLLRVSILENAPTQDQSQGYDMVNMTDPLRG